MEDAMDSLSGYFYVSDTLQKNSSAIYFNMKKDYHQKYIAEFTPTLPDRSLARNVVYVKSHEDRKG